MKYLSKNRPKSKSISSDTKYGFQLLVEYRLTFGFHHSKTFGHASTLSVKSARELALSLQQNPDQYLMERVPLTEQQVKQVVGCALLLHIDATRKDGGVGVGSIGSGGLRSSTKLLNEASRILESLSPTSLTGLCLAHLEWTKTRSTSPRILALLDAAATDKKITCAAETLKALVLHSANLSDAAMSACERAVNSPSSSQYCAPYYNLFLFRQRVRLSLRDAEQLLRDGLKVDPHNPALHYNLGNLAEQRKDYRSAMGHYDVVIRTSTERKGADWLTGALSSAKKKRLYLSLKLWWRHNFSSRNQNRVAFSPAVPQAPTVSVLPYTSFSDTC